MKNCPKCNNMHTKTGRFCSRTCANSRTWTEADKKKKAQAAQGQIPWNKGETMPARSVEVKEKISNTRLEKSKQLFLDGKLTERKSIKRHLAEMHGYTCAICTIDEWNSKPITLHLDHIDGNAANNNPNNLRLLCPNCHSQTETFGAKNKGNGRKSRGLSLR